MEVAPIPDPARPDRRYILEGDGREVGELVLATEGEEEDVWTLRLPEAGVSHEIPAAKGRPPIASAIGYAEFFLGEEG